MDRTANARQRRPRDAPRAGQGFFTAIGDFDNVAVEGEHYLQCLTDERLDSRTRGIAKGWTV